MDSSTIGLLGLAIGALILWGAVKNANPLDEFRAAFDSEHRVRPLTQGVKGRAATSEEDTQEAETSGQGFFAEAAGLTLVELFWGNKSYRNGKSIRPVPDHYDHIHAATTANRTFQDIDAFLKSKGVNVKPCGRGQCKDPRSNSSLHPSGRARDYGQSTYGPELVKIWALLEPLAKG